jgi:large subunit ribosomal protein L31e
MVKEGRQNRKKASSDIVTRDYTIHMSKRLYGVTFKNRAPRAVREVKKFAEKAMKTKLVYLYISFFFTICLILIHITEMFELIQA